MSDDRFEKARLAELRQRATLEEYQFVSAAPGVGRLLARLRAAWNGVATKWQVRPMLEQQSAFNRSLVDWLARRQTGMGQDAPDDVGARLIAADREATQLSGELGAVAARAARLQGDRAVLARGLDPATRRLRVAYFSPLPPARSGIAGYSADLLPYLSARADVTLFAEGAFAAPGQFQWRPVPAFAAERWAFDMPLYHMGNSAHHRAIYDTLLRFPGLVVLHDAFLHHFLADLTLGGGSFPAYAREMGYALGEAAGGVLRDIRAGVAPNPLYQVPLHERLIDASLGLIVHSRFVAEMIRAVRPAARVRVIPQLVAPHAVRSRRAELGLSDEVLLIAAVGQVTAAKQLPLALRAFRRLLAFVPEARFLIVGEVLPEVDLEAGVHELGLGEQVIRLDYVESRTAFDDWAASADIVLNLRYPTLGETSAAALRVMAAGRALAVFDHGWYAEIPEGAALKVPPMDEDALLAGLLELARSPRQRAALGAAAARYVADVCDPARVADAYIDFISDLLEPAS